MSHKVYFSTGSDTERRIQVIPETGRVQEVPYGERLIIDCIQPFLLRVAQKRPKQVGVDVLGQFDL